MKKLMKKDDSVNVVTMKSYMIGAAMLVGALFMNNGVSLDLSSNMMYIYVLAILLTKVIADPFYAVSQKHLKGLENGIFMSLTSIFAIAAAVFVLQETITPLKIVGIVIVVISFIVSDLEINRKAVIKYE